MEVDFDIFGQKGGVDGRTHTRTHLAYYSLMGNNFVGFRCKNVEVLEIMGQVERNLTENVKIGNNGPCGEKCDAQAKIGNNGPGGKNWK